MRLHRTTKICLGLLGVGAVLVGYGFEHYLTKNHRAVRAEVAPPDETGEAAMAGSPENRRVDRPWRARLEPAPVLSPSGRAAMNPGTGAATSATPSANDIVDFTKDAFTRERPDPAWAPKTTAQINSAILAHLPAGATLGAVQCKSTMCTVEAQYPDQEAYRSFQKDIMMGGPAVNGLWAIHARSIITERSQAGVKTLMFIAREGHDLPSLEQPNEK